MTQVDFDDLQAEMEFRSYLQAMLETYAGNKRPALRHTEREFAVAAMAGVGRTHLPLESALQIAKQYKRNVAELKRLASRLPSVDFDRFMDPRHISPRQMNVERATHYLSLWQEQARPRI